MKLSVILPVYNTAQYLEKCINSILSQTFKDFELIIINDGSSDNSVDVIKRFTSNNAEYNEKIVYISQEHAGVSAARNAGLNIARGEYIAFVDSDDYIDEFTYELTIKQLEADKSDLLIFSLDYINENGSPASNTPLKNNFYSTMDDFTESYFRTGIMSIYPCVNKIYKHSIIDEYNMRFREELQLGEDRMFNYLYLDKIKSVSTSAKQFYHYLIRNHGALSQRYIPNYIDDALMFHQAKMQCFERYNSSGFSIFRNNDIMNEVSAAISNLLANYANLTSNALLEECKSIINAHYPPYFGNIDPKALSKRNHSIYKALQNRNVGQLKMLLWTLHITKRE